MSYPGREGGGRVTLSCPGEKYRVTLLGKR